MGKVNPWEGVFRFTADVIENPFSTGGRVDSLLVVNIRYKKDNTLFTRDHCWIKHKKHKVETALCNTIVPGDKVEFSAKLREYTDNKGKTKVGLSSIKSIHKV